MSDYSKLKALAEALNRAIEQAEHKPGQWSETAQSMGGVCCPNEPFQIGKPWAKEEPWASFSYKRDSWLAVAAVNALPQLMALIAEIEEYKAVAEQPASLNAVPATEYAVLKRQFFALRNYALCKDKLSGYYSRELEKMRGVDRSQSAVEIDAERDINEQLTNDLLSVETERDDLKAEIAGLKTGYEAYEAQNAALRSEVEALRKNSNRYQWLKSNSSVMLKRTVSYTTDLGRINTIYPSASELDVALDAAMGKGEQS
ncbi:hypothetical protein [Pseudomonas sp. O230]|uniref:hypothetical protein n=1 Tax=Pseudomonas sp. O230 TaxID=3159450 RepID=UPI00387B453A